MISKNQQKLIRALGQKKQREKHGMFVIEGNTIIADLLGRKELNKNNTVLITATEAWIDKCSPSLSELTGVVTPATPSALKQITSLMTPPDVIALARIPAVTFNGPERESGITLVFDAIRDPGNLGTIIRTADWFGYRNIVCSTDSVDAFNSKVVQSSMGAIIRLQPAYRELAGLLEDAGRKKIPVFGTTMDGADLFDTPVKNDGLILFGNESAGIRQELMPFLKEKIRIPDFPAGGSGTESLNVASSVAVVCAELRRRER